MSVTIEAPDGYGSLALAFGAALDQASRGKGSERHAEKDEPFSSQLICAIPRRLGPGGECFCLGQAVKKIYESRRLPPERARAEILGAINYLAAAWGLLGGFADVMGPAPEKPVSAPEDFQFDEARMRESMPGIVPQEEDAAASPYFGKGEPVEFRSRDGTWKPASFMHMDGGYAVLVSGGEKVEVLAFDVRKAEKA